MTHFSLKELLCCIAVVLVLNCSSTVLAGTPSPQQSERIVIAVHDSPAYYNKQGRGMVVDLLREAFATQGYEVEISVMPVKRSIVELIQGRVDAYSPGRAHIPPDSIDRFTYVDVFKYISGVFKYSREGVDASSKSDSLSTPDPQPKPSYDFSGLPHIKGDIDSEQIHRFLARHGLVNKKLAALTSYNRSAALLQRAGIQLVQAQNPAQMVKIVLRRDIDLLGTTLINGLLLTQEIVPQQAHAFKFIPLALTTGGLAFRKDSDRGQHLARIASQGFATLIASGEYLRILESYWGKGNVPRVVLPEAIDHRGTEKFDRELFWQQRRDRHFRIVEHKG